MKSERGATLVEKALLISLIAVMVIPAAKMLGATVTKPLCTATGALMYVELPGGSSYVQWGVNSSSTTPYCYDDYAGDYLWK